MDNLYSEIHGRNIARTSSFVDRVRGESYSNANKYITTRVFFYLGTLIEWSVIYPTLIKMLKRKF